jgi:putative transposase
VDDVPPHPRRRIVAGDFFGVDTIMVRRYDVVFFIELDTRRVHLAGTQRRAVAGSRPTRSATSAIVNSGIEPHSM